GRRRGGWLRAPSRCPEAMSTRARVSRTRSTGSCTKSWGWSPSGPRTCAPLLHRAEELRKLHYFAVEGWRGEILNQEAEALLWIPLDEPAALEIDVDRTAVAEYVRLSRSG